MEQTFVVKFKVYKNSQKLSSDKSDCETHINKIGGEKVGDVCKKVESGVGGYYKPTHKEWRKGRLTISKDDGVKLQIILSKKRTGFRYKVNVETIKWPFNTLRSYGSTINIFGFECGRRSPHGEGVYIFQTSDASSILNTLRHSLISLGSSIESSAKFHKVAELSRSEYKNFPLERQQQQQSFVNQETEEKRLIDKNDSIQHIIDEKNMYSNCFEDTKQSVGYFHVGENFNESMNNDRNIYLNLRDIEDVKNFIEEVSKVGGDEYLTIMSEETLKLRQTNGGGGKVKEAKVWLNKCLNYGIFNSMYYVANQDAQNERAVLHD